VAQHRRGTLLGGHQRGGLRLGHRQRIALGTISPLTAVAAIVAVPEAIAAVVAFPAAFEAVALAIVTLAVVALAVVAVTAAFGALLAAFAIGLGRLGGFLRLCVSGGLGAALVLEIDVEAGGELIAAEDFAGRPLRLHGAQQSEVVLGVLQVVFGQHPVARRTRVTGQLLVFLEHVLGVAAHLHAVGPVGVEGPVRVLLWLAPAAAPVAAALTLHTLEISHSSLTVSGPALMGNLGAWDPCGSDRSGRCRPKNSVC